MDILQTSAANLSRVYEMALRVWESEVTAREWLNTPVPALGGERPMELFGTFEGRKWVHQTLRKIETGDFS